MDIMVEMGRYGADERSNSISIDREGDVLYVIDTIVHTRAATGVVAFAFVRGSALRVGSRWRM